MTDFEEMRKISKAALEWRGKCLEGSTLGRYRPAEDHRQRLWGRSRGCLRRSWSRRGCGPEGSPREGGCSGPHNYVGDSSSLRGKNLGPLWGPTAPPCSLQKARLARIPCDPFQPTLASDRTSESQNLSICRRLPRTVSIFLQQAIFD